MVEKQHNPPAPDDEEMANNHSPVDIPKMVFGQEISRQQDDDAMSVSTSFTDVDKSASGTGDSSIGAADSRRVRASRIVMFCILALFAAGLGTLTWFYTTGQEQSTFETTVSSQSSYRFKL